MAALRDSRCPAFGDANSEFLLQVKARMCHFSRDGNASKELVGKPAAAKLFNALVAKAGMKDSTISFHDIGPVIKFRWLLSEADAKTLDDLAKGVWKAVGEKQQATK